MAAHEAVGRGADLERSGTCVLGTGGAETLDQGHRAEGAPRTEIATLLRRFDSACSTISRYGLQLLGCGLMAGGGLWESVIA